MFLVPLFTLISHLSHYNFSSPLSAAASVHYKLNVCVGAQVRPACANGGVVNILSALWGRQHTPTVAGAHAPTDALQCAVPPTGIVPPTGDWEARALSQCVMDVSTHVRTLCHGRRECTVQAERALLPDTCPSVWKYLALEYTCVHGTVFFLFVRVFHYMKILLNFLSQTHSLHVSLFQSSPSTCATATRARLSAPPTKMW